MSSNALVYQGLHVHSSGQLAYLHSRPTCSQRWSVITGVRCFQLVHTCGRSNIILRLTGSLIDSIGSFNVIDVEQLFSDLEIGFLDTCACY